MTQLYSACTSGISADQPKPDFCLFTQKSSPVTVSAARLFYERCKAEGHVPTECGGVSGDCQGQSLIRELLVNKVLKKLTVPQLRALVASWLEAQENMDGFIVTDEFPSWAAYCKQVRDPKNHTWGDNFFLIAVCNIFGVQIRVTSISEKHDNVCTPEDGVFEIILHLGHIPEQHYVAMTNPAQMVLNNYL